MARWEATEKEASEAKSRAAAMQVALELQAAAMRWARPEGGKGQADTCPSPQMLMSQADAAAQEAWAGEGPMEREERESQEGRRKQEQRQQRQQRLPVPLTHDNLQLSSGAAGPSVKATGTDDHDTEAGSEASGDTLELAAKPLPPPPCPQPCSNRKDSTTSFPQPCASRPVDAALATWDKRPLAYESSSASTRRSPSVSAEPLTAFSQLRALLSDAYQVLAG